jgi:hypothetical protein
MGHSFHVAHDHVIDFQSDKLATGRVTSHAELIRNGEPYVVALRYEDVYARENVTWRFRERALCFYYYLKVTDYSTEMAGTKRMRGMGEPIDADWPEKTVTFRNYQPIPKQG